MRIQLKGSPQLQTPITEAIGRFEATGKKQTRFQIQLMKILKSAVGVGSVMYLCGRIITRNEC